MIKMIKWTGLKDLRIKRKIFFIFTLVANLNPKDYILVYKEIN